MRPVRPAVSRRRWSWRAGCFFWGNIAYTKFCFWGWLICPQEESLVLRPLEERAAGVIECDVVMYDGKFALAIHGTCVEEKTK